MSDGQQNAKEQGRSAPRKALAIRIAGILAFVFCSLLFFYFAARLLKIPVKDILELNFALLLAAFAISTVFSLLKALAWKIAFHSEKMDVSYYECFKLFSLSSLIDFLFFPSTISADLFKLAYLKKYSLGQRLRSILLFRVATSTAYLLLLLIYFASFSILFFVAILIVGLVFAARRAKKIERVLRYVGRVRQAYLSIVLLTLIIIISTYCRAYVLVMLFDAELPFTFLLEFIASHFVGVISTIPMGLGAKDLSLGFFLANILSPQQIAIFLVLLRLTGDIYGGLLGWLFSAGLSVGIIRDYLSKGREEKEQIDKEFEQDLMSLEEVQQGGEGQAEEPQ